MDILISGASVAGTALAFWLRRAGHTVTVVERAPAVRDGGYAIDVRGTALQVAERMGVAGPARRLGTDTLGTSFVNAAGKRIATLPLGFGVLSPGDIEIMKSDFTRLLYESVPDGVEWIFGDTVTALDPAGDGARVTFARSSGGAPRRFDLVLGADGLHSAVRALAFGPPERFVHDLGSRMAIFTAPNELGIERWQLIHNATGRVVSVKTDPGNATIKVNLLFGGTGAVDHRDHDARREHVAAAFAGCGWQVPRLLEHLRTAPDFYYAPNAQVRMDAWTRGPVALVGDAGYCPSPLTGQGTGLALVGAYILARELAAAGDDHVTAFARYETVLRHFVEVNQRAALVPAKGFAPRSAAEAWLRDLSIRLLPHVPWRNWILELMTREAKRASEALELGADDARLLRIGGATSM